MVNLVLFCMASIGLTCIILESNIFAPIRNLLSHILPTKVYEVFECHQCMGTWVGFLVGFFLMGHSFIMVLCCGFAGSFLTTAYHRLFVLAEEYVLSQTQMVLPEDKDEDKDG
jgi:hypothetical protein